MQTGKNCDEEQCQSNSKELFEKFMEMNDQTWKIKGRRSNIR